MGAELALGVLGQLEKAIAAEDRPATERLLMAALAVIPPDTALRAVRHCIEGAIVSIGVPMAEAEAIRHFLSVGDGLPSGWLPAQMREELQQLELGVPAGPYLHEAVEEYVQAARATRDAQRFILMLWRSLHACVAAEVEADDARRNPTAWQHENAEMEWLYGSEADGTRVDKARHMALSAQRRMVDAERMSKHRDVWLRVVGELRTKVV
jgi:hypothetical protein